MKGSEEETAPYLLVRSTSRSHIAYVSAYQLKRLFIDTQSLDDRIYDPIYLGNKRPDKK